MNKNKLSLIKSKPQLSLIKSKIVSQIESKTGIRETADVNDWDHGGRSYAAMGGFLTQMCTRGNHNGIGYARGRRRRCSMSVKWEGFHVRGPQSGSLKMSLVPTDWQVRVFDPSDLV